MTIHTRVILLITALVVVGCGNGTPETEAVTGRWYAAVHVEEGAELFQIHCASCHGSQAEGTTEWRTPDANGNYPPPPLNGSAHAWHHPKTVLLQTIAQGGVPLGGVMPGFAEILTEEEALATIAFFQNQWPDETYARWLEIDRR